MTIALLLSLALLGVNTAGLPAPHDAAPKLRELCHLSSLDMAKNIP
jgi:hypothetical protein